MTHQSTTNTTRSLRLLLTIMMVIVFVITAGLPTHTAEAAGVTLYVTTSGTDNGSCGPILTPCATIAQAVTNATDGDIIIVGSGIFFPPTDTPITIDKNLTIQGQGASNTMVYRTGTARRIFDITAGSVTIQNLTIWNGAATGDLGGGVKVSNGASLSLNSVTLKENQAANGAGVYLIGGGSLTVNDTVFTNNVATGNGGAIYMSGSGTLTITDSTFGGGSSTGNQAVNGAAIYQVDSTSTISGGSFAYNTASGSGGAVYLTGSSASLSVSNAAQFTHNTSSLYGGGFFLADGSLQTETGTMISSNSAVENGGGIYQTAGSVTLSDTAVSSNSAKFGGGLYQQAGLVSVLRSTFNDNTASTSGAGLYLASSSGAQSLTNSTISENTANGTGTTDGGGAVYKAGSSTLTFDSVTVANNLAARNANSGIRVAIGSGAVTAQNTIFAANGTGTTNANCSGTIYAASETNLDSGTTCGFSAARSSKNPQLLALADNGGYTFTHALPYLAGANPAIDSGSTTLLTDQRGKQRPSGDFADVGAFEYQLPTITLNTAGALSYGELSAAAQIAPLASYTDDVSTYAPGDQLTVTLTGPQTGDLLGIAATANISVDENGGVYYVFYNGTTNIGSVTGGKYQAVPDSSPLVISFNSSANRAAIELLIRAVTFENTAVNPDTTTRSASFIILHNLVESTPSSRDISVTNTNLPPVAKNYSVTIDENETWTDSNFTDTAHYSDPDLHPMYGVVITQLPTHGTLTVNGVSPVIDTTIAIGAGDMVYTPDPGYFGSDSFLWKAVDNGNEVVPGSDRKTSIAAATYSITIVAINDAPTTNGQLTKSLAAVDEDTANPAGATITDLVTSATTAYYDADGDTFAGIAVVANAAVSEQGTWQFSTNGGSSWVNVPVGIGSVIDNTKALVLETTAMLRFVPTANWNGTPGNLSLRVWDGTEGQLSGPTGILRNISGLVGGSGAYSAETLDLVTSIAPVNDAPTEVLLSMTSVLENLPQYSVVATISSDDIDLVTNPATETMTYTLGGADAAKFRVVGDQLQTNEVFDYETTSSYSITIQAEDSGGLTVVTPFTITVTNDSLAVSIAKAAEGDAIEQDVPTDGHFILTLEKAHPSDVTVSFSVSGTATLATDYWLTPDGVASLTDSITFPAGETTRDIYVRVYNDGVVEADETVILTLTSTDNADVTVAASPADTASVTIADDDTSIASVAATTATAVEGGANGQFTVTLTKVADTVTTISYTLGGTAINTTDYMTLSGSVVIDANTASATIDVAAISDSLVEGTQTVVMTLTGTTNSAISASGSDTVSITDIDTGTISIAGTTDAREPSTNGLFTVSLSLLSEYDVTVVLNSPANPTDYAALPATITIPAGSSSTTFSVNVINDTYDEYDETLTVSLGAITAHGDSQFALGTSSGSILIYDDDVLPKISIDDVTIDPEGASATTRTAHFTVTLDRATEKTVRIDYATSDDTAVVGSDYLYASGTHTFNTVTHETSFTIDVTVNGDDLVEGNELFDVDLVLMNGDAAVIKKGVGVTTIVDDDYATASIVATSASTNEGSGTPGQTTVTLTNAAQVPVVISYSTGGTAAAGTDYTSLTGSLTIPANTLSAVINVASIQDNLVEGDETVTVTLLSTDNGRVTLDPTPANQTASVTVVDDDLAVVSVSATTSSVLENSGSPAVLTLSLDKPAQSSLTVNYDVTGSATSGTDFTALSGSVTIPALATSATIDVAPVDDLLVEGDETVIVTLTGTNNSRVSIATGGSETATATITDNDTAEISIQATQSAAAENDSGTPTNGEYTVSLSNPARADITVDVAVSGSAAAGVDFTSIAATVTIPAGDTSKTIDLAVIEDTLVEGDETATLTISNPQAAGDLDSGRFSISSTSPSASVTITDDDYATLTITASLTPAAEGGANGEFTITASKASQAAVIVDYAIAGTATNGTDYTDGAGALSGTVTLPAETTSVTIPVVVVDDSLVEGSETVNLTLTAPDTGRVLVDPGSAGTATVDIYDNDQALISIQKLADTAENGSAASFQISVDKPSQTDLDVTFALSGTADSAGLHQDYSLSSPDGTLSGNTLTIPGGSGSVLLTVTPLDDSVVEGSESVIVTLTGPTEGLTVVTPVVADQSDTMTVADDDTAVLTIASSGAPSEDGATGKFTITASKVSQVAVVIGYSIGGTAANGTDYTSGGSTLSGTVTLPAFTSSVEIPVSVVNDLLVEETETIILTLSTPDSGLVQVDPGSGGNSSLSIIDNDTATIAIHASANAVEGGAAGHYVVSVSKASQAALEVTFAVGGLALETDDYSLASTNAQSLTSTTVTLPPGALSVDITVNAVDDNLVEGTEDLIMLLTGPKVGTVKVGTPNSATINITDNDTATIAISALSNAAEGGSTGQFEITASKPLAVDLTITFAVSGSADKDGAHQDYSLSSTNPSLTLTTITLAAGDQSAFITVNAVDDAVVESIEEVILTLTQTSNERAILATGGAESGVINLSDNDTSVVSVTPSVTTIAESDLSMQFTVTAIKASQTPVVVTYTMGGAAVNGVDYNQTTPLSGTVTIPAYATQATIALNPVQDNLVEGSESISLTLSGTDNASVAVASDGSQIANVTLTDDDTAEISIAPSVSPAAENGAGSPTNGEYTITMTNPARADVTVDVAISGTAANGTDYTTITSNATIPAGATSTTINLAVIEDALVEGDETVVLTISNPAAAGGLSSALFTISGTADTASITITDDDTATASITWSNDALEPSTDGQFTVSVDKVSAVDVILYYSVDLASTATSGSDYTALSGEVVISANQASAVIVVDVLDDSIAEFDETVSLTLSGTSSARVGLDSVLDTASLTIVSDDPDPVISVSPVTVAEGDSVTATAGFTVSMDRDSQKGVSVHYATSDGSAVQAGDYTSASGTLNLGDGTLSAAVDVSVIGDVLVEGDETFTLTLDQAVNATLSNAQPSLAVTGTITNDDASVVSISKTQDAAEPATNGVFTVSLSNPVQVDTTVYYSVIGSAASGSDYTALPGSVLIPAGSTSQTINVAVLDDAIAEFSETVQVTISSASDPLTLDSNPTNLTATVNLADNETDPTISVNDVTVTEGDSGTSLATFTVSLSRMSEKGVSIQYRTSNSTAVAPSDYLTTSGTLTFGSSELTRTISVPVVGNQVVEIDKYFDLVLENPVYATINKGVGAGTILDNDTAVVQIHNSANAAEQDLAAGEFSVSLSLPVESAVTITYSVNGTAVSGSDFSALSGSVIIPANTLNSTIVVTPVDDSLIEGDETVGVTLTGVNNSRVSVDPLPENSSAVVTIADNDTAVVSVSATTASTQEGSSTPATFTITSTNAAQVPIVVYYTISGSATADGDYTALAGSVTLPTLETSVAIDVSAIDDDLVEPLENITLTLDSTNNASVTVDPLPANQASSVSIDDNDTALVSLTVDPASTEEGSLTPGTFTFTLSKQSQTAVTISYSVAGSATAVDDYAVLSGSIVIPALTSSVSFDVYAIDDVILEGSENVSLALTGTNNAQVTVDPAHQDGSLTLVDNDTSAASIAKTLDAAEPSTNGQFTVTLTNPVQVDTTINYTVSGSATVETDYTALSGTLVIPALQTSGTISVAVLDDTIAEYSESVQVDLDSASGLVTLSAVPADLTATANITDNDPDPVISVSPITVAEGSSGTTTASFTVSMDRDSQKGVSVRYATSDGSALQPGDYTAASGTLNLGNGTLSAPVEVTVISDVLVEGDETFNLTLDQAINATLSNALSSLSVSGTITDDDSASVSILKSQDAAEPATNGRFTLTLSNPVQVDTTITYSVAGTASAGSDYTALSGSVIIPANQTSQTISVVVQNDLVDEFTETVVVNLTGASGLVTLDPTPANLSATVNITDDDADPTVSINDVTITEGDSGTSTASFTVTISRLSEKNPTIQFRTSNASAVSPDDYLSTSGTLTFAPGELSHTVSVQIVDNQLVEVNKSFNMVLENPVNLTINKGVGTGTIQDNDTALVQVTNTANAAEQDTVAGEFTVTLSLPVESDVTVSYSIAGTAVAGSDYTALTGSIVIPANTLTATIPVTPINDSLIEGNETVVVSLTGTTNGSVTVDPQPANNTASVTITDNDTSVASVSASVNSTLEGSVTPGKFTVALTNQVQTTVTVFYSVTGTAASEEDYTALTGSVVIPALTSSVEIDVASNADNLVEGNETVIVTLTSTNNASVTVAVDGSETAEVTITDDDTAEISIAPSVSPAAENGAGLPVNGEYTITMTNPARADVTVDVAISGTATNGTDYTTITSSVTIPAGATSTTINLAVIEDALVEGDETVVLTISNPAAAGGLSSALFTISGTADTASITITDDDTATASITWTNDALEPSTDGQFTVIVDKVSVVDVTLYYSVDLASTATSGSDYTALSGEVVIPANQASAVIVVDVLDDSIAENDETVSLTLSGTSSARVSLDPVLDTASLTIVSDDPDPVISVSPITVAEGDSGTATAGFTVSMDRDSQKGVSVHYATSDGSAVQAGDYTSASGTLNLGNGTLSAPVEVTVISDVLVEGDETFNLTLDQAVNATLSNALSSLSVSGTITDDDSASVSILKSQDAAEPATNGRFTLTLSNPVQVDTTITYSVAGTASAGSDYTALSGTLTIPALSTTGSIAVPVIDDLISENAETVVVTLTAVDASGLSGLSISGTNGSASLAIADNETDPRISIENISGSEAMGTFTFYVTLDRASEKGVSVNYMTASSSATDNADFTPASGTLNFTSTQTSLPITISVVDDSLIEGDETFTIVLYGQTNATLLKASAIGTIVDNDFATVSVSTTSQAAEDAVNGQFSVALDTAIEHDIQVYYSVEPASTAASGTDYTALSGTVTIPSGQTSAPIDVAVIADKLVEGDENVQITLTGVSSSLAHITAVPENKTALLTIADNDTGKLSVSATTATASEPSTNGRFTISLDNPTQSALQVTYTITGSADANSDYLALTGTATIPAMGSSVTVDVTVVNNDTPEYPETVILTLTGPNNALFSVDTTSGNDTATVTINDEDPDPGLSVNDVWITEGDSGTKTLTFTITLSGISAKTASVDYTLTEGSATAGEDYVTGSGSLTFNPGETSKTVDVTIYGDTVPEADETFDLVLTNPVNLTLVDDTGVATILDNDTPELSIDNITLAEGNSGTTAFTFTVTLSPASTETVTVDFATSNSTAEAGTDYTAASGSLTFNPLETAKTITIDVAGDTEIENDETFYVTLSNPSANAVLSSTNYQGVGTIQNDEGLPVVSIDSVSQDEGNGGTSTYTFTVTLSVANISTVTVNYATENGTATVEGSDYAAASGTLTYNPGELTKTISVTVNGDRLVESDETFTVRLSSPVNATLSGGGASLAATGTILNDDHAPALLGNLVVSVDEDSTLSFTAANFTNLYNDTDSDPLVSVTILSLPSHGTLRLNTVNISADQVIPLADLGKINYAPAADYSGSDSFSWTASDGVNLAGAPAEVQITVNPVNDPPTLDAIQDVTLIRSVSSYTFQLTGISGGVDNDLASLSVTAVSDNTSVLPDPSAEFQTPANIWVLALNPTGTAGTAHVTVTVDDHGAENNITTRSFTVNIMNASLVVTPSGVLSTSENGGTAVFYVSLGVKPLANVTIAVSSSNTAEGTVSVDTLSFTPENWNVPQQVTVTGVDDAIVDGDITYQITLDSSGSSDSEYALLTPTILQALNHDNDTPTSGWRVFIPFVTLQPDGE